METAILKEKAEEFIHSNGYKKTDMIGLNSVVGLLVGFAEMLNKPEKLKPIELTYFKTIDELNEWFGDGKDCEILSIVYDYQQTVHTVYYRLK